MEFELTEGKYLDLTNYFERIILETVCHGARSVTHYTFCPLPKKIGL